MDKHLGKTAYGVGLRVLLLVSILLPLSAQAEGPVFTLGHDCTFSWEHPTTRVGGSPLSPSEISASNVYVGNSPDALEVAVTSAGTQISCGEVGTFPADQYYAAVTTIDTSDVESDLSDIIPFEFRAQPPSVPTLFRVE